MRRLSADSNVAKGRVGQRAAAVAAAVAIVLLTVALSSRSRIAPPRPSAGAESSSVFINIVLRLRVPRSRTKHSTFVDRHSSPRPRGPCAAVLARPQCSKRIKEEGSADQVHELSPICASV